MTAQQVADALSDEEIRSLTLWETIPEITAFKIGWCYRREHGHLKETPDAKQLSGADLAHSPSPDWGQNERVAWERGWMAADAVHTLLVER